MNETWPPADPGFDSRTVTLASDAEQPSAETQSPDVEDLVVLSNRQPYRHSYDETGALTVDRPAGGLTAGLDPVLRRLDGTWIAWGDGDADRAAVDAADQVGVPPEDPAYTLERVWLSDEEVRGYYEGYANQALWPLCHLLPETARFEEAHWEQYRQVNERFADAVVARADPGATVWFQDYHFALAPRMARERLDDDVFCMQFWHIPWPAVDAFRRCPQRTDLLRGLLGNDLLGFHVGDYCRNFLDCVEATLDGATVDRSTGRVEFDGHTTTVRAFPLHVDAEDLREKARTVDDSFTRRFDRDHDIDADTSLVLGVDRLDYTKGIPKRFEALERLWADRPEWRGAFTYVQKGCRSRSNIPAYQDLQREVREGIERVNDRFGTDDWTPVVYTDEMFSREELCGLYRHADVALVSPLCDGMNLVAQEYVASQVEDDGVLVLSEFAGAHDELGEEALSVNPYDTADFAATIEQALTMNRGVKQARMAALRRQVHDGGLDEWITEVLETGATIHAEGDQ
jgi:alpha,alpha-trehalose-phosphate synthase [UDP-forming]